MLGTEDSSTDEQESDANYNFRKLVTLHIRLTLLSEVFTNTAYAHGRAGIGLLQTLMGSTSPDIVSDLGALHRATIWENISLKSGLSSKGIDVNITPNTSPIERSPDRTSVALPDTSTSTTANGIQPELPSTEILPPSRPTSKQNHSREQNANALKHLTHSIPGSLAPFFQGILLLPCCSHHLIVRSCAAIVKVYYARRNPDAAQKKQIMDSSSVLADMMLKHVAQEHFGTCLILTAT